MHLSVYDILEDKTTSNIEEVNKLLWTSYSDESETPEKFTNEVTSNVSTNLDKLIEVQGRYDKYVETNYSNGNEIFNVSDLFLRTLLSSIASVSGIPIFSAYNGITGTKKKPDILSSFVSRNIIFERVNKYSDSINYIASLLYGKILCGDYMLKYIPNGLYITSFATLYKIIRPYCTDRTTVLKTYKVPKVYENIEGVNFTLTKVGKTFTTKYKRLSVNSIIKDNGTLSMKTVEYGKSIEINYETNAPLLAHISNMVLEDDKNGK